MNTECKSSSDTADETIVARATASGVGGVAIIRVSGPLVSSIAKSLLGKLPKVRQATYSDFRDQKNNIIDIGLALYFKAPYSFTGEDVLELHGHGGQVVSDCLIKAIIKLGARLAKPGEFSERAFLNDKIDLTQAEAIADLINSRSEQAAKSALKSLQGEFSQVVDQLIKKLIHLRMYIEAAIDFPEEEIDFLADHKIKQQLDELLSEFNNIIKLSKQGVILQEGLNLAICGPPNAGKSSLLNALAGDDVAIVTDIPGTTRDSIKQVVLIDGIPVNIIDTAGLRETSDVIEQEGIKRSQAALQTADHILFVVDANHYPPTATLAELWKASHLNDELPNNITLVRNKIDLTNEEVISESEKIIKLSVKENIGLDYLKQHLLTICGLTLTEEHGFIARRRHLIALENAKQATLVGKEKLLQYKAGELLAEELRLAQQHLDEITGKFTTDDLLGEIFSSFCIGK